jgi:hypothetical protein
MTPELIAMLGGGVSGFVMKMIAAQAQNQARQFDNMLKMQGAADKSADAAAKREGGVMVRRFLVFVVFFAIIIAPFILSFLGTPISIQSEKSQLFGLFKGARWDQVSGYVILPEVRQTALAIVGFYFGSSQVK